MSGEILRISGEVETGQHLSLDDLRNLPSDVQIPDVSAIDSSRAGTAVWLKGLLAVAKLKDSAKFLGLHSDHDNFHASIPLAEVLDRGFVIYAMDGEALPREKGGPIRFYIPDHASCNTEEIDECANVKFVDHIELTASKGFDNRPEDEEEHAKLHQK